MFKTARFKVHNPSRHKSVMLWYAMTRYHLTLKSVLEKTLALPDLVRANFELDKKGKLRPNKFLLSKLLYTIAPKNWELAPLRDYLIGDASAMIMSHLSKAYKGENESNPPTMPSLGAMTDEEFRQRLQRVRGPGGTACHQATATEKRSTQRTSQGERLSVARRLVKDLFQLGRVPCSRASVAQAGRRAAPPHRVHAHRIRARMPARLSRREVLPARPPLRRGAPVLARQESSKDGFIDCKAKQPIGGKRYPGLILPLEMDRDFHEHEYLTHGSIQSAKLVVKRRPSLPSGQRPKASRRSASRRCNSTPPSTISTSTQPSSFSRRRSRPRPFSALTAARPSIGAATLIDRQGRLIETGFDLDGSAFAAEMRRFEAQTRRLQKRGIQRSRKFSLRGKRADAILGEYANRIVAIAERNRSQIVIEAIRGSDDGAIPQAKPVRQAPADAHLQGGARWACLPRSRFRRPTRRKPAHSAATGTPPTAPRRTRPGKAIQDVFKCVACGHAPMPTPTPAGLLRCAGSISWKMVVNSRSSISFNSG